MKLQVAVIGAGIIGLSSAYHIQKQLPQAQVTVVSDQFTPNTTSDVAAGIWLRYILRDTPLELQKRWSKTTLDLLHTVACSPEASDAGVFSQSGYMLYSNETKDPEDADSLPGFRRLTRDEMAQWPGYTDGYFFTTHMCECLKYLPWLHNKFKAQGGHTVQRHVKTFDELYDSYDIVVNCTGLGARKLTGDLTMEPIKGQIFRVTAPWVKHFYMFDDGEYYILPGEAQVVVGGTKELGAWDTSPSPEESRRIWSGVCKLEPSLKKATIKNEVAGLRPSRPSVRVETELVHHHNKVIPLIHNYGHGGAGITLHWGCAIDVAEMVVAAARKNPSLKSKL